MKTKAFVSVKLEILSSGGWQKGCSLDQVKKQAIESALIYLRDTIRNEDISIIEAKTERIVIEEVSK